MYIGHFGSMTDWAATDLSYLGEKYHGLLVRKIHFNMMVGSCKQSSLAESGSAQPYNPHKRHVLKTSGRLRRLMLACCVTVIGASPLLRGPEQTAARAATFAEGA